MSGSLPLVLIFLGGVLALCWADLGKKRADAQTEAIPETETRIDQRFREYEGG